MEKPIMFRDPRILLTSETKYINVADMKKISLEDLSFSVPLSSLGRNGAWFKNDEEEIYYLKRRGFLAIILNELIGEYLSKYMGFDTVEYDLAYEDDDIVGLFSKNFRKPDVDYVYSPNLTEDEKAYINRVICSRARKKKIKDYKQRYTDYLMRNFYANQGDKVFNAMCYRDKGLVYLSTLFDYESSFYHVDDDSLIDPFLMQDELSYDLINELRKKDKCFDRSIEKVLGFNMEETLEQIKDDFGVRIPDMVMDHYTSYDKERKRLMKENISGKRIKLF